MDEQAGGEKGKRNERKEKKIDTKNYDKWIEKKLRDEWWQWVVYEIEKEEMKLVSNENCSCSGWVIR